jgi:hypothetical protein
MIRKKAGVGAGLFYFCCASKAVAIIRDIASLHDRTRFAI